MIEFRDFVKSCGGVECIHCSASLSLVYDSSP